jgi:hypothetical protein
VDADASDINLDVYHDGIPLMVYLVLVHHDGKLTVAVRSRRHRWSAARSSATMAAGYMCELE